MILRCAAGAAAGTLTFMIGGDAANVEAARPLLELQARWSALPTTATLVAETLHSREGWHLFLYPFAGRHAHLGLAK